MKEIRDKYGDLVSTVDDTGTIRDRYGDRIGSIKESGPDGVGFIVAIILIACLWWVFSSLLVFAPTWVGYLVWIILLISDLMIEAYVLLAILNIVFIPYLIMVLVCKFKYQMSLSKMFKLLFRYFLVGPFAYPEIIELKNILKSAK